MKCNKTHKPVGLQFLQLTTSEESMRDSEISSISSHPLGQQCPDQASTQKIVSDNCPHKTDIILKHIQRLDDERNEVNKDRHEILALQKITPVLYFLHLLVVVIYPQIRTPILCHVP